MKLNIIMVIITGSEGFIGSNFKKYLRKQNKIVEVTIDNCDYFIEQFDKWEDVTLIIHQGAISSTTEKNVNKLHKFNVMFTLSLFQKAIKHQIDIKYASSASVYGNNTDYNYNPLNYYAISKLQIDLFVKDNIDLFSKIQGFRYYNVYGNGEEEKINLNQSSPVSKFKHDILKNGYLNLFEGSDQFYRDFVNVDDVINVVLNNKKNSGIYDLGTSTPISFKEVAELVANKFNGSIIEIPFPDHLKGKYQSYTCAKNEWDNEEIEFKTVKEYLDENNLV